jgi:hypothetical protein
MATAKSTDVATAKSADVGSANAAHVATAEAASAKAAHMASAATAAVSTTTTAAAATATARFCARSKKAAGKHRACQNHHHSSSHDILHLMGGRSARGFPGHRQCFSKVTAEVAMERRCECLFAVSSKFSFNPWN